MYDAREYVEAGGLTSYGVSLTAIYSNGGDRRWLIDLLRSSP